MENELTVNGRLYRLVEEPIKEQMKEEVEFTTIHEIIEWFHDSNYINNYYGIKGLISLNELAIVALYLNGFWKNPDNMDIPEDSVYLYLDNDNTICF